MRRPARHVVTRPPGRQARGALPRALAALFWDYDFRELRWDTDRDLVVARVLASGDWRAARWLRRRTGPAALREWIEAREGRGLDARTLRFWALLLDLPRRRVDAWLRAREPDLWERRTGR